MSAAGRSRNGENLARNISLIGFMGAGKTTVGKALAERLGMSFVDLDEEIVAAAGMSVPEIFAREGEEGFRERESAALKKALDREDAVIACGGGAVLRDDNVALLRNRSRVFLLRISAEEAEIRLKGKGGRPLLSEGGMKEAIDRLLSERAARYEEVAHEAVEAKGRSPEEVVEEIVARWLK